MSAKHKTIEECYMAIANRIQSEVGVQIGDVMDCGEQVFFQASHISSQECEKLPKHLQDKLSKEARHRLAAKAKALSVGSPFIDVLKE